LKTTGIFTILAHVFICQIPCAFLEKFKCHLTPCTSVSSSYPNLISELDMYIRSILLNNTLGSIHPYQIFHQESCIKLQLVCFCLLFFQQFLPYRSCFSMDSSLWYNNIFFGPLFNIFISLPCCILVSYEGLKLLLFEFCYIYVSF
jgi:hypothetical protein